MQAFRTAKWFEPADRADFHCTQCNTVHVGADRPRLDHNGRCEGCRGYCNGVDCECPANCECTHSETCGACPLPREGGVVIACSPTDQWATVPTDARGLHVVWRSRREIVDVSGHLVCRVVGSRLVKVRLATHEEAVHFAARLFAGLCASND